MLGSVYTMRRVSMIASIASSVYISLFTYLYNINIILFLPLLWSLSSICLTLNFVRNRTFIHEKYKSFKLWYNTISCKYRKSIVQTSISRDASIRAQSVNIQEQSVTHSTKNQQNKNKEIVNIPIELAVSSTNGINPINTINGINTNSMENRPMHKPRLTSIESGTEMDDHHFTQPIPFQCGLPGIVENVENERQGNTPSMIMSQNSDRPSLYDNTSNQSVTVSTRTSRWYHSIKNKISTPLAVNQNAVIDFSLEPINIPHSPQNMYNMGAQISRPNTYNIRGSDAASTQSYASPLS